MHSSQGIKADNHRRAEPEGEAWLSAYPMAMVHQLIYIPPLIGQWLQTSRFIETNSTSTMTRRRIVQFKQLTQLAD